LLKVEKISLDTEIYFVSTHSIAITRIILKISTKRLHTKKWLRLGSCKRTSSVIESSSLKITNLVVWILI